MSDTRALPRLESALTRLFPSPDEAFLASLELDLQARLRPVEEKAITLRATPLRLVPRITAHLRAHRWASITIAILLAIILSILAIGPSRLASAWQRLSDILLTGV